MAVLGHLLVGRSGLLQKTQWEGEQGSLPLVLFRGPVTAGSKDTELSPEAGELFPGRLSTSPNLLSLFSSAVFCSPFVVVALGLL